MLTEVLQEYCLDHGLVSDLDKENAASRVLAAFLAGAETAEQLRTALSATVQNGSKLR
jgi:hypothetical protein